MEFKELKTAVQRQFNEMKKSDLFMVNLDKDLLWKTYLSSFPEGTNCIFRERTDHNCQCCKSFIRSVGNMVSIDKGKIVSIWDVNVGGFYQVVADAMSKYVKSCQIDNIFLHPEKSVGTDKNYQQVPTPDGFGTLTWEHFYVQIPDKFYCKNVNIGTRLGEVRSTKDVMLRSLKEISIDSIDTVLELIGQNSLYRGEENKFALQTFWGFKSEFDKLNTDQERNIFCWSNLSAMPTSVSKIRGTSIGTLLIDLSEGVDMEKAVASFEAKVAPTNYKRPTSLVTKSMIENAQKKLEELGLTSALERRFAVLEDITVNNILFANREAKKRINNVFDELSAKTSDKPKNLDKVEEVSIDQFISNILPKVDSVEVMFENKHVPNLVSLIAPSDLTAKHMFKWSNGFSWSYNGEVADSIKERVKLAGGRVDVEFDGIIHSFAYPKVVKGNENVIVAEIRYSKKDGFKIIESIPSRQSAKEVWGIPTQSFHKVSVAMLSPNHWDEKAVGNKHYFFMLEGCINDGKARGFYNEFLTSELDQHRKVFEIVGSKMKAENSPNQMSGLGFSSTQRNSVLCRVKGSFTRTIKINF